MGHDMQRHPSRALASLGVVFQQTALDMDLPVMANLLFHTDLHGLPRALAKQRIEAGLARMGLATSIVLDGQWNVDTTQDPLRASASLRRASGDLRILAGDATAVTAVQSSGQGTGAGGNQGVHGGRLHRPADVAMVSGSEVGTAIGQG